MAGTPFTVVDVRLMPEGRALLLQMVDLHTTNPTASYRHFILAETGGGADLIWTDKGQITVPVSRSILNDLRDLGLLRVTAGGRDARYEVTSNAVRFVAWLRARGGPMAAVEREARRLLDDGGLTLDVTHHLTEALELVWSDGSTTTPIVIEIGQHLRSAVQQAIVAGAGGNPEHATDNIDRWFEHVLGERDRELLANTVKWCLRCTNRLTHIADETVLGRPLRGRDEVRRIAFLVVTVCGELAALDHLP